MSDSVLAVKLERGDDALAKHRGKLTAVLSSDQGTRVQSNGFFLEQQNKGTINEELQLYLP